MAGDLDLLWAGRPTPAICFNTDLGDAWEWADAPEYLERYPGWRGALALTEYSTTARNDPWRATQPGAMSGHPYIGSMSQLFPAETVTR